MKRVKISIGVVLFIIVFNSSSAFAALTPAERAADIIHKKECIKNAQSVYRTDIRAAKNIHKERKQLRVNRGIIHQGYISSRIQSKTKKENALRACVRNS